MRWAALFRRPPILRGVSASHIRADHAVNQARINAHCVVQFPSSLFSIGTANQISGPAGLPCDFEDLYPVEVASLTRVPMIPFMELVSTPLAKAAWLRTGLLR